MLFLQKIEKTQVAAGKASEFPCVASSHCEQDGALPPRIRGHAAEWGNWSWSDSAACAKALMPRDAEPSPSAIRLPQPARPCTRPPLPVTRLTARVTGGTHARLLDCHFPSCCANLLSACGHLIAPAPRLLHLLEPGLIACDGCGAGRIVVFVSRRETRSLRLQ